MTPPQPYRLVNARPSPYGRKVAIALIEKGIPFEVIDDEPWSDHTRTGDYGPLRQLPILITPDGYNVCDSSHILDWLEIVHPIPRLLPAMQSERIFALNMRTLGERLMEIAQGLIFEMYRDSPSSAYIARQTQKIYGGLVELERLSALLPARDSRHSSRSYRSRNQPPGLGVCRFRRYKFANRCPYLARNLPLFDVDDRKRIKETIVRRHPPNVNDS
ncbi:glutathione S-transferase N-terminal domain-containing protein [Sphingomonas sp. LR55]|uniref:glutathione S-transferase N-terminal domain-containing protein n=1 Tax=Sphingomonas sp. LR55 TaxID=3050231 RepID=UPI002FE3C9CE